jgi:hypothetical protein
VVAGILDDQSNLDAFKADHIPFNEIFQPRENDHSLPFCGCAKAQFFSVLTDGSLRLAAVMRFCLE